VTDREAKERINKAFQDGVTYGMNQCRQSLDILFNLTKNNVNIFDYYEYNPDIDLKREDKNNGR